MTGSSAEPFDTDRAARLKLDWWIVHRQREQHEFEDLQRALAELQSEIYKQPVSRVEAHALARAQAMLLRDPAAQSGDMSEADWGQVGALLDQSWAALRTAVAQSPVSVR